MGQADAGVAGRRPWDRTAYSGVRQIEENRRHLRTRRRHLRPQDRRLPLPRRQGAHAVPTILQDPAHRCRQGRHDAISRKQLRLRSPPIESPMLSQNPHRKILRSIHEGARDIAKTEDYEISRKLRKKAEMPLADLKRILGLGRLRLRGPCGAEPQKAGKADPKGRKAKPGVRERTAVPTGTHSKTQATEELFNKIGQVLPIGFQTGTRPEYGLA